MYRYLLILFLTSCINNVENIKEFCGDGIKNNIEECDDGNKNNNDDCTEHCLTPFCGDGFENNNEECDYETSFSICDEKLDICYSCVDCLFTVE